MQTKLERDVRFLKIYAVCLTILVACLAAFGLCSSRKRHFKEVDVERINVREKSGKLDLVISMRRGCLLPSSMGKSTKTVCVHRACCSITARATKMAAWASAAKLLPTVNTMQMGS